MNKDDIKIPEYVKQMIAPYQWNFFLKMIESIEIKDKVIAEVGSDKTFMLARLCAANGARKVIANNFFNWDISPQLQDNIEFQCCDFLEIEIKPHSVDVVFGNAILEHVADYPKFIEKILNILKPDGHVFLQGAPFWPVSVGHHLAIFDPGEKNFSFHGDNPVPHWSHLVCSREEMNYLLSGKVPDLKDRKKILEWIFQMPLWNGSNKKSANEIKNIFKTAFYCYSTWLAKDPTPHNEFYEKAREIYSDEDLTTYGINLVARPKVFVAANSKQPLLTVILSCDNEEMTVEESLKSILNQDWQNLEIICVYESKNNKIDNIVEKLAVHDPRIVPLTISRDFDAANAFNAGAKVARGQTLLFIDCAIKLADKSVLSRVMSEMKCAKRDALLGKIKKLGPASLPLPDADINCQSINTPEDFIAQSIFNDWEAKGHSINRMMISINKEFWNLHKLEFVAGPLCVEHFLLDLTVAQAKLALFTGSIGICLSKKAVNSLPDTFLQNVSIFLQKLNDYQSGNMVNKNMEKIFHLHISYLLYSYLSKNWLLPESIKINLDTVVKNYPALFFSHLPQELFNAFFMLIRNNYISNIISQDKYREILSSLNPLNISGYYLSSRS